MAIAAFENSVADELAVTAALLQRSTVHVRNGGRDGGAGSGVIWRPEGLIVTNAHVARGLRVQVETQDGTTFEAEVMDRDPGRDLAALRVDAQDLPAATIGDSNSLRVGQLVTAVGNPLGMTGALTLGIIHAIAPAEGHGQRTWIQADVTLLPGNSGGPLADARGHVIGINSMVSGGLGLAVPSNAVELFLGQGGQRPHLGLTLQPVLIPRGPERLHGMLVLEVAPGLAAEQAGIGLGDIVIGMAGHLFAGPVDMAAALQTFQPGITLTLDLLRGGTHIQRQVRVGGERRAGVAA